MLTTFISFIIGLLLGTLLNIIIIRLSREKQLLGWPRCTRTGQPLTWWQLLPVLGWALQRGRAADGRPLHWIYPLVELLTAVVLALLYRQYGPTITFLYLVFVCAVLIVTGAIDWLYHSIYTVVILGSAVLSLLASLIVPKMSLLNAGLGAIVAGFVFIVLFMLALILFPSKSAPLGLGDVYLAIFIGATVGLTHLSTTLFYGIFLAGVVAGSIVIAKRVLRRQDMPEYIPYGTYLCLGTIGYILFQGL